MDDKYSLLFLSDALPLHSHLTAIDIEWAPVQLRQQQVPPPAPAEVSVILRCEALHTQALTEHRNYQSAFNISHRASLTTLFLDFLLCWPFHPLFFLSSLPRPLSPSLLRTHMHIRRVIFHHSSLALFRAEKDILFLPLCQTNYCLINYSGSLPHAHISQAHLDCETVLWLKEVLNITTIVIWTRQMVLITPDPG